jgi:hypothetical protein
VRLPFAPSPFPFAASSADQSPMPLPPSGPKCRFSAASVRSRLSVYVRRSRSTCTLYVPSRIASAAMCIARLLDPKSWFPFCWTAAWIRSFGITVYPSFRPGAYGLLNVWLIATNWLSGS